MASWFERNIKNPLKHGYFGNQKGSDADYGTDQESFANFQDTIDLLSSEKAGIADDYTNAIEFAGQSGQFERKGIRAEYDFKIGKADFAANASVDTSFNDSIKMSMLQQRQSENQAAKAQRESIFGVKSSMQEAYTSFLSNRLNLEAGDYDFDVEDQFGNGGLV
jgi:hypothetical protein